MSISLLSLIYFIALSHALLMAVVLWQHTNKGQSGRILAIFLVVFAYKLFEGGVMHSDLYRVIPHALDWLPGVVLIIGPIFYGYIRSVSGEQPFSKIQWFFHLIPAILLIVYNSPQVLISASEKIANIEYALSYNGPMNLPISIIILLFALKFHFSVYLIRSWMILNKFEKQANQLRADNSFLVLKRHKQLCLSLVALESLWIVLFVLQQVAGVFLLEYVGNSWLLFMATIILAMGYYGLQQPRILFSDLEREFVNSKFNLHLNGNFEKESNTEENVTDLDGIGQLSTKELLDLDSKKNNVIKLKQGERKEKYQLSTISESASLEIIRLIDNALKEKQLFLDEKLTLTILSEALSLKPHTISQVINQSMKLNFYQLINRYRVNYAIELLNQEQTGWSIERIAYESGFANRVTFNTAFKALKGCSASAYRKQLKKAV